jgi:hypothetical protein
MKYDWEIAYIDLDADQLVLKLTYGSRRCMAMHIFERAHMHDWRKGDLVASDPGDLSVGRVIQEEMGVQMREDDYTLYNQRTGGKGLSRKEDWKVEKADDWVKELVAKGLVDCP